MSKKAEYFNGLKKDGKEALGVVLAHDSDIMTVANKGVPFQFTSYLKPQAIEILFTKNTAEKLLPARKLQDWTVQNYTMQIKEGVGNTAAYGDFSNNAQAESNYNYAIRQQFLFQTHIEVGELEAGIYNKSMIDLASDRRSSAVNILSKTANAIAFNGVSGLINYGLLNDPNLLPDIAPDIKASGSASWNNATSIEIYNDVKKLLSTAINRANGLIDESMPFKLALPPSSATNLMSLDSNIGYKSALTQIKEAFPNCEIVRSPELATTEGNKMMIIFDNIDGNEVGYIGFSDKLRTHNMVQDTTNYRQKLSAGSFGSIIEQPLGIAGMVGI